MNRKSLNTGDKILDNSILAMEELIGSKNEVYKSWIAGFTPCGESTARVIIGSYEPITVQEAVAVIKDKTDGKLNAFAPSLIPLTSAVHNNVNFVAIHCYKSTNILRPANNKNMANCHAITATSYMDMTLNNVWERKNIDGQQFLVRANEDNPETVLTTALLASTSIENRVDGKAFTLKANKGDYVMFFAMEQSKEEDRENTPYFDVAQITANNGDNIEIILEEGGYTAEATIPSASVVQTIVASSEDVALGRHISRSEVIDFLKQCYPKEYGIALDSILNTKTL